MVKTVAHSTTRTYVGIFCYRGRLHSTREYKKRRTRTRYYQCNQETHMPQDC